MSKTLKAYEVREPDEGNCVVIFDEKNVAARRRGACELGCEFKEVESCLRKPEFDQYAPGPVPLHATLAAGWWHGCCGCGCEFDADGLRGFDYGEEKPEIEPVEDAQHRAYCSPACMMGAWQKRRMQEAREVAAIECGLAKWPQALQLMPYNSPGTPSAEPNGCYVLLPGLRNYICWVFGTNTCGVTQEDAEAFRGLYGVPADAK